jgi:hypothetical protein
MVIKSVEIKAFVNIMYNTFLAESCLEEGKLPSSSIYNQKIR